MGRHKHGCVVCKAVVVGGAVLLVGMVVAVLAVSLLGWGWGWEV